MKQSAVVVSLALALALASEGTRASEPNGPPTVVEGHLGPPNRFAVQLDTLDLKGFCNAVAALPSGYTLEHREFRTSRYYAARVLAAIKAQTTILPPDVTIYTLHGGDRSSCVLTFDADRIVGGKHIQLMMIDVRVDMRGGEVRGAVTEYRMFSRRDEDVPSIRPKSDSDDAS